jgi:hypothetical protein
MSWAEILTERTAPGSIPLSGRPRILARRSATSGLQRGGPCEGLLQPSCLPAFSRSPASTARSSTSRPRSATCERDDGRGISGILQDTPRGGPAVFEAAASPRTMHRQALLGRSASRAASEAHPPRRSGAAARLAVRAAGAQRPIRLLRRSRTGAGPGAPNRGRLRAARPITWRRGQAKSRYSTSQRWSQGHRGASASSGRAVYLAPRPAPRRWISRRALGSAAGEPGRRRTSAVLFQLGVPGRSGAGGEALFERRPAAGQPPAPPPSQPSSGAPAA